jgi:hypothetical protein
MEHFVKEAEWLVKTSSRQKWRKAPRLSRDLYKADKAGKAEGDSGVNVEDQTTENSFSTTVSILHTVFSFSLYN